MIKEFAFSISNRHHFQDASKASDWMGLQTNTFVSLYDYDDYVIEYFTKIRNYQVLMVRYICLMNLF